MRWLRALVILLSVSISISLALLFITPPDYIGSFRTDAVKEETTYVSMPGYGVMRLHVTFLQSTSPDEIKLVLRKECPATGGWVWMDFGNVGSVQRGETQIAWAPTEVAT